MEESRVSLSEAARSSSGHLALCSPELIAETAQGGGVQLRQLLRGREKGEQHSTVWPRACRALASIAVRVSITWFETNKYLTKQALLGRASPTSRRKIHSGDHWPEHCSHLLFVNVNAEVALMYLSSHASLSGVLDQPMVHFNPADQWFCSVGATPTTTRYTRHGDAGVPGVPDSGVPDCAFIPLRSLHFGAESQAASRHISSFTSLLSP